MVALASLLNIAPMPAFAYWLRVLLWMAERQPDGNAGARTLEEIGVASGWPSAEALTFGSAFYSACADMNGIVIGWETIGQGLKRQTDKRADSNARTARDRAYDKTWMTPYAEAWHAAYGGEMAFAKNASALAKLHTLHDPGEVLRRWVIMLGRNQPQFANAHLLVQGWDTYAGTSPAVTKRKQRAAAFYEIIRKYGLVSMAGSMDRINQLEKDGVIRSAETFVALLRLCDRDLLRNAKVPHFAINHIDERLGAALDG